MSETFSHLPSFNSLHSDSSLLKVLSPITSLVLFPLSPHTHLELNESTRHILFPNNLPSCSICLQTLPLALVCFCFCF